MMSGNDMVVLFLAGMIVLAAVLSFVGLLL